MLNFVENKFVVAIARTALVLIYFMGGFSLLTGNTPVEFAATKGVPAIAVYVGYAIKLFGGLAVIIGFQTRIAALLLAPFLPDTAPQILERLGQSGALSDARLPEDAAWGGLAAGAAVSKGAPLFPRVETGENG